MICMGLKTIHLKHNEKYACNWAVNPQEEKMSEDPDKVTCKNCQRINFHYST